MEDDLSLNSYMYSWSHFDEETDEGMRCFIRGYGISIIDKEKLTKKQLEIEKKRDILDQGYENVSILIENFTPYCYVALPTVINNNDFEWNDTNVKFLQDKISNLCGKKDYKPIKYRLDHKRKLYFAHKKKKVKGKYVDKLFPYLFIAFNSNKALVNFEYKLKKPIDVYNVGRNITFKVHEGNNADPILKMCSIRKLKKTGWLNVVGTEIIKDKESLFEREIVCTYRKLTPIEDKRVPMPKLLCFDGEMNSKIISAMPDPSLDSDKVFQISCVLSRNTKYDPVNNYYERILLTLGNPNPIEKTEIRKFKNEGDLLIGFSKLIVEKNPNVCIGYNIFGFDIDYMYKRAKHNHVEQEFLKNSCLINKPAFIHDKDKWASSAFGKQNIIRFESEGRLFFDIMPFIKRNYKLVNYKLSTVAVEFKVGEKDPLKPKDIFKCYREFTGQSLYIVGKYCVQDSITATQLWEKLFLWISLNQESIVNNVAMIILYTKGQQIKMFAQVYYYCMYHNYVVESNGYEAKADEHYTGALVLDAKTGIWVKVASLDFASLYPSIMISHNIDYSTCVMDDNIPDEDCHVFKWEEHVNCEHDLKYKEKEEKKRERKERIAKNKAEKERKKEEKENNRVKKEIARIKKIINKNKKDDEKSDFDLFEETDEDTESMIQIIKQRDIDKKDIEKQNEKKSLKTVHIDLDGKKTSGSAEDQISSVKKICGSFHYRFLKSEVSEKGVIPSLLEQLLASRKETRKVLKEVLEVKIPSIIDKLKDNVSDKKLKIEYEELTEQLKKDKNNKQLKENLELLIEKLRNDKNNNLLKNELESLETESIVLEKRQLNYKVSANSMYGAMGVKKGYLPFLPGAMCVTYVGRKSIFLVVQIVENEFHGKVIYGDSVTKDTPILCKNEKGKIFYKYIKDIGKNNDWEKYYGDKEYRNTNLKVWSDKGFTKINKVIRHKTNKKIFKISTNIGIVNVTEDHSLLDSNSNKISPKEIKIGTELLTHNFPKINNFIEKFNFSKYYSKNNNKLENAELYYLNSIINTNKNKDNKVKRIYEIEYNDYVYDLETENHHFSAGIGKLIVHNTDSVMIVFDEQDVAKICAIARKISQHSTTVFPAPMKLEFENKLYYNYLLLTKKRYALRECDEFGVVDPKIKSKGIVLSRRDNSKFLKQLYKSTIEHIFDGESIENVLGNIIDYINKLFSRSYSYKDFVITKGLTRDDYKVKPAHALLAEKMRSRGITVQIGSKIGYIITTEGGNKYNVRQKDKIEDEDYFAEWKEILRVDFLYIFEKQSIKPIDEVLEAVYESFRTRNVSFMKEQFNIRKQKEQFVKKIADYGKPKLIFKDDENDVLNISF